MEPFASCVLESDDGAIVDERVGMEESDRQSYSIFAGGDLSAQHREFVVTGLG